MTKICPMLMGFTLLLGAVAHSNAIEISATHRGAYTQTGSFGTGGSGTLQGNYLTGAFNGNEYRSFYNFDLSALTGTVASAAFKISTVATVSAGGPNETFGLFDFTGSILFLIVGAGGVNAWTDLGTGTLLGSLPIPIGSSELLSIEINAAGVAALNSALGGEFALGGANMTIGGDGEYLFGSSRFAALTVIDLQMSSAPVPAAVWLFGSALGLLAWKRTKAG